MGSSEDSNEPGETYGTIEIDDQGQLTLPEALRDVGDATFREISEKTRDDLNDALRERAESRERRF